MPPRSRSPEVEPEQPNLPPPSDLSLNLSPDPTQTSPLFSPSRNPEQPLEPTAPESSPSPGAYDESGAAGPGTPSAPRSTSSAKARLAGLKETATALVGTAGGIAHRFLTRAGSAERDADLWVPDEDDVEAISDPIASLASRRLPEGAGNPDVTDFARLALGVLGYFLKQLDKSESIQRYELRADPGDEGPPAGEWEQVAEPSYP